MKELKLTKQPDSIENIICRPMDSLKKKKLTGDDEMIFKIMGLNDRIPLDAISKSEKPYVIDFIEMKLQMFDYKVDDSRIIALISQVSKSLGFCVLYLAYLQYLCKKKSINHLTFDLFCDFFKDGFFTKEDLEKIWLEQKIERVDFNMSDNLIDYEAAYKSIKL